MVIRDFKKGQSLVELIIAMAIFAIIAGALVTLAGGNFNSLIQAGDQITAEGYLVEAMEAVRSIRDRAWNEIVFSDGVSSGIAVVDFEWEFNGQTNDTTGQYTRTSTFFDVCRDASSDVVPCGSGGDTYDIHSKIVDVLVSWQNGYVGWSSVFTNWASQEWIQTNWSAGSGQAIWFDATQYDVDDGNIDYSSPGEIKLKENESTWVPSGGEKIAHATDTDFSGGSLIDTTVNGTGLPAVVQLESDTGWFEHADSQVTTSQTLNGIAAVTASNVWVVGNRGTIIHYDGTNWLSITSPTSRALNDIYFLDASHGWAVGDNGTIIAWDGVSWTLEASTISNNLNHVVVVAEDDVWAVGASGKILHRDAIGWSEFHDTGNHNWRGMDMVSATNGWLVGASGKIWHYDGIDWTETQDTGGETWRDVEMVSATDGWVVGDGGLTRRYNGTLWNDVSSPNTTNALSVSVVSATEIWHSTSGGAILKGDGTSWAINLDTGNQTWHGIEFINSTDGWIVGARGRIWHYGATYRTSGQFLSGIIDGGVGANWSSLFWTEVLPQGADITIATRSGSTATPDAGWSPFSAELANNQISDIVSPDNQYFQYRVTFTRGDIGEETPEFDDITIVYNAPTAQDLFDVAGVAEDDVWVVGAGGEILHYDGVVWQTASSPTSNNLNSISMVDTANGWAVGDSGTIVRYQSGSWSLAVSPVSDDLHAVHMVNATYGWASGESGKLLEWDGITWSEGDDTGNQTWYGIAILSSTDGWVVGSRGEIYQFNGTWSPYLDTGGQAWRDIVMLSSTDGWFSGSSGNIYHYDGLTWSLDEDTGSGIWQGIDFVSATEGWVVRNNGNIRAYDGVNWVLEASPASQPLNAVSMISATEGWAVGDVGTIIHYTRSSPFVTEGSFESSAYFLSDPSPVQVVAWDESIPSCSPTCFVRVQVRTAPDISGTPGLWTAWVGAGGSGNYFTDPSGGLIPALVNGNEWVQYRVELFGDGNDTPVLEDVMVNYK